MLRPSPECAILRYTVGTYTWSVTQGADLVQMDTPGNGNVVKITPKAPSQSAEDVEVKVTFTTPSDRSVSETKKLTVCTPGEISIVSTTPADQQEVGGALRNITVYQVWDQLDPPRPLRYGGIPVTEQFSLAYPPGCNFGSGNTITNPRGGFTDTNQVSSACRPAEWEPTQTLTVGNNCVQRCHIIHFLGYVIDTDALEACP